MRLARTGRAAQGFAAECQKPTLGCSFRWRLMLCRSALPTMSRLAYYMGFSRAIAGWDASGGVYDMRP